MKEIGWGKKRVSAGFKFRLFISFNQISDLADSKFDLYSSFGSFNKFVSI